MRHFQRGEEENKEDVDSLGGDQIVKAVTYCSERDVCLLFANDNRYILHLLTLGDGHEGGGGDDAPLHFITVTEW